MLVVVFLHRYIDALGARQWPGGAADRDCVAGVVSRCEGGLVLVVSAKPPAKRPKVKAAAAPKRAVFSTRV